MEFIKTLKERIRKTYNKDIVKLECTQADILRLYFDDIITLDESNILIAFILDLKNDAV